MHPQALFNIFGKGVYLYGICIGVGLVACILFFFYFTKKRNMPQNVQDFSFFVAIGAIALGFLFAKLFQTFYEWIDTGEWDFYGAGITVMGGLIGGAASFIALYFLGGELVFKGALKGIHIKHFKTVLIVAQRISTIMNADKIIVLNEGNIVGMGTHKELLKKCKVYKEIALSQLSKEELDNA